MQAKLEKSQEGLKAGWTPEQSLMALNQYSYVYILSVQVFFEPPSFFCLFDLGLASILFRQRSSVSGIEI